MWLQNELNITYNFFNRIFIFPECDDFTPVPLPENCIPQYKLNAKSAKVKLSMYDYFKVLVIAFSDIFKLLTKTNGIKEIKYNISLTKKIYSRAIHISNYTTDHKNIIVYSYWADNGATQASIFKMFKKDVHSITRAHGFEIYETLKKNKFIPFRNFQNKYLDAFYSVSKKGLNHLQEKYPKFKNKYQLSYLGTNDYLQAPFDANACFTIITCCYLNPIKRIDLLASVLKHISFDLTWHIIGSGPELEKIKANNSTLSSNINIVYHGSITNTAAIEFYKTNHVNLFISLSYLEGLPVSMMEAQSFGIPILSTDVGGCSEICTERTGILIPRDFEPAAVAQKITVFKESDKNSKPFRDECRKYWSENFSARKNYSDFVNKLIKI